MVVAADNEPTRPEQIPQSPGWTDIGSMEAQQRSANEYQKFLDAKYAEQHRVRTESQIPGDTQSAPDENLDQFRGKLDWAIEFIDGARQEGHELEHAPTAGSSLERPQGHYDDLTAATRAKEADQAHDHSADPMAEHYSELTQAAEVQQSHERAQPEQSQTIER